MSSVLSTCLACSANLYLFLYRACLSMSICCSWAETINSIPVQALTELGSYTQCSVVLNSLEVEHFLCIWLSTPGLTQLNCAVTDMRSLPFSPIHTSSDKIARKKIWLNFNIGPPSLIASQRGSSKRRQTFGPRSSHPTGCLIGPWMRPCVLNPKSVRVS